MQPEMAHMFGISLKKSEAERLDERIIWGLDI